MKTVHANCVPGTVSAHAYIEYCSDQPSSSFSEPFEDVCVSLAVVILLGSSTQQTAHAVPCDLVPIATDCYCCFPSIRVVGLWLQGWQ